MTDTRPLRQYTKSSRSGGSGGNCVEWAHEPDTVFIRDSKNPAGPELSTTQPEWWVFLDAVTAGREHPWISRAPAAISVSKDGERLVFTSAEWAAFVAAINAGECLPGDATPGSDRRRR